LVKITKKMEAVNKIEKLWDVLATHNEMMKLLLTEMKTAIDKKDYLKVGEIAGEIQVIAVSDVCYSLMIEMLEDLLK